MDTRQTRLKMECCMPRVNRRGQQRGADSRRSVLYQRLACKVACSANLLGLVPFMRGQLKGGQWKRARVTTRDTHISAGARAQ